MIPAHANGASTHGHHPRPPRGTVEPLERVFDLGRQASSGIVIAIVLALLFHGSAAARAAAIPLDFMRWSRDIGQKVHDRLGATVDIDVMKPPDPPPAPLAPPPEVPKEEPKAEPPPPPPPSTHSVAKAEAPAPAAAQAGAVLTKAADPDEPVDLTGFVNGTAAMYAGGVTEQGGTSTDAVYNRNARKGGVVGGTGTAINVPPPPPPGPDRSRPAGLEGASEWKCPWPSEADAEQIDEAYVTVQVTTTADGTAESVNVVNDPGHGFAREARRCAMRERYKTALDHDGNPIRGVTKAFRIHFER